MTIPRKDPEIVAGFRVLKRIARGGMATVYKAEQISIGRVVALKVLSPRFAEDRVFVGQFQREARAAARLNHPNIVSAIDVGEADGYHYFAMEYIDGESAGRMVKRKGRFEWREAVGITLQIARALAHAHSYGMMHLDVKPANIMLTSSGQAKLADFGLARRVEDEDELYNEKKLLFGTPGYMSPEQLTAGKELDIRSDMYSLGVTLYELLAGQGPFRADDRRETIRRVRAGECAPLFEAAPDVPEKLRTVVAKMMDRDRDERYLTPGGLVADLENVLEGGPPRVALGLPPPEKAESDAGEEDRPAAPLLRMAALASAVALGLLLAAFWIASAANRPEPKPPAPPRPATPTPRDELAAVEKAAGAALAAGSYEEAANIYRRFAEAHENDPTAQTAAEKAAEVEAAAVRHASNAAKEATARATRGEFDRAEEALSSARRAVGGLGGGILEKTSRHIAELRRAAEAEAEKQRARDATETLANLEENLSRFKKEGAFRKALSLCDSILANRSLEPIHEEVRVYREPFERMVEFENAVLRGAGRSAGMTVTVGGKTGRVLGAEGESLRVNVDGTARTAAPATIDAASLHKLAAAGTARDPVRLRENAALYFEAAGRPVEALGHVDAALRGGSQDAMVLDIERRLLFDLARGMIEQREWEKADGYLSRLMGDRRHRSFVYGKRREILEMRRTIMAGRRYAGMILVPAGSFAQNPRRGRYTGAFYIDRHEVTVAEYAKFVEAVGRKGAAQFYGRKFREKDPKPANWEKMAEEPDHPVVGIDWNDATAYARFAGKRLPTALEWEKAGRGKKGYRYPWGANWIDNACNNQGADDGYAGTAPVGSFKTDTSPYGCRDMAGNAREWTADSVYGGRRVVKGGSYIATPGGCLLQSKSVLVERARDLWTGFRCAADAR